MQIKLAESTLCTIQSISRTQIVCETKPMHVADRRRQLQAPSPISMTVTLESDGGEEQNQLDNLTLDENAIKAISISPAIISPIAFRTIDI